MLDHGVYVIAFSYPVVPQGQARIRVQLSAAHSEAQLERLLQALAECWPLLAQPEEGADA